MTTITGRKLGSPVVYKVYGVLHQPKINDVIREVSTAPSIKIMFCLNVTPCGLVDALLMPLIPSVSRVLFLLYRGADKSLARPGREQATATEDFDVHISYL